MDQNWFYLIEQASDMSKIELSFIIYACCLNKTAKTTNKLTNEQPSSHFFLTDPLFFLSFVVQLLFFLDRNFANITWRGALTRRSTDNIEFLLERYPGA